MLITSDAVMTVYALLGIAIGSVVGMAIGLAIVSGVFGWVKGRKVDRRE